MRIVRGPLAFSAILVLGACPQKPPTFGNCARALSPEACPPGTVVDMSIEAGDRCKDTREGDVIMEKGRIAGVCGTSNGCVYACRASDSMCSGKIKAISLSHVECKPASLDLSPEVLRTRVASITRDVSPGELRLCRWSSREYCERYSRMRRAIMDTFPESGFASLRAMVASIAEEPPPSECQDRPGVDSWCKAGGTFMATCADRMDRVVQELVQLANTQTRTIRLASTPGTTVKLLPKINVLPEREFTTDITLDAALGQYNVRFEMPNGSICKTDLDLRNEHIKELRCTRGDATEPCKCTRLPAE